MSEPDNRCNWGYRIPEEESYHDHRWCRPVHDDRELFAMLCLEGKQAGLSWSLILKREAALRQAFDGFDPEITARYDEEKLLALRENPTVIRNRAKIKAVSTNAVAFLRVQQEFGSFDRYIWSFTGGKTIVHHPSVMSDIPAQSELSVRISQDLQKRGFHFVGPVIIYSYLQAIGMVNDHLESCPFKYAP